MQINSFKSVLTRAVRLATVLLFGAGIASAQSVNLTAGPANATLPDGSSVPMWGYSCGAVSGAMCAMLNPAAPGWSPVVITVAPGPLTINLTNSLPTPVPTSLTIVGQLGGGLGTTATSVASPSHDNQQTTWPIAASGAVFTPPTQGTRVQSFSTEVLHNVTTALTWLSLRPGTYLLESGTHPSIQGPMGLYGILVVTAAPTGGAPGTAYPAVPYNAELPLLFSEIDPVQNKAVVDAVGKPGFIESATRTSGVAALCTDGGGTAAACYPSVVNYSPLYYLINGVAFDKTHASTSLFSVTPATGVAPNGDVLVRMVNAGLRMHVPSIVGSTPSSSLSKATATDSGFTLIAEDGNVLPGAKRVQTEVFMAAGKTYDVMIKAPSATTALPIFDRQLSLSSNSSGRDAGMLAYISVNNAPLPSLPAASMGAVATADSYLVVPGNTLSVLDPSKGLIANDLNVYGVKVLTAPTKGTLTLAFDGTFTYAPNASWTGPDSFVYQANGTGPTATVNLTLCATGDGCLEDAGGISMGNATYTSNLGHFIKIADPGVLTYDSDSKGYPLAVTSAVPLSTTGPGTLTATLDNNGGFVATATAPGTYTFTYKAKNSQGTLSASAATITLIFPTPTGLTVDVQDGTTKLSLPISASGYQDYRWIIEEDRTFFIDPTKTTNSGGILPTFGTNFHTSYMPVVATGCTGPVSCETGQFMVDARPACSALNVPAGCSATSGQRIPAVCDIGNGVCRPDLTGNGMTPTLPGDVHLDPTKRYYLTVLPGDAADALAGDSAVGHAHGMGGAPITTGQTSATVLTQPTPFPPSKLSVFVFEDDFPLNGEQDAGGGVDILAPNEPGLGQFNITIMDDAGGPGDATGQVDYDMFNQPLSNSLAGTIDPATNLDACPVSKNSRVGADDPTQTGITGTIITCPKYEGDGTGKILSPLAGQAVVANMMPGRYGVIATPAADRIARGEEWLQTNTLDGQKAHDSFLRIGEAGYFQEYGPAGYHVAIGFANPKIINSRLAGVCNGSDINITGPHCTNTVKGMVTTERMSRTPDERLYSSGSNDSFAFTQCYISVGDPDGEDFAFTKCNSDGTFSIGGLPDGNWRVTVFDQWNDMLVDGLSTPVLLGGGTTDMGQIATNQWQADIYTTTFFDQDGDGVRKTDADGNPTEPGLALVPTNIRFRDGSFSNFNSTDLSGNAGFNEVFPLFNWYVVETDATRFKNTGTHVVYDAGGPADGTTCGGGYPDCSSTARISHFMANTVEKNPVRPDLRVPGAVYCDNADCDGFSIATGPVVGGSSGPTTGLSTGRIDPPWVLTEGWQGFSGQNSFLEFGKKPYAEGENGGIKGHVVYASTRPFDDPQLLLQLSWEPLVPNVTINLYKEGTAPDGTTSLTLVDTTQTSSFDDWAQGFRSDGKPNMSCPGQTTADLFYFTLYNQQNYLDAYDAQHSGGTLNPTALPYNSQYKCYDGMHNWNQLEPAPYDGLYQFPSVTARDSVSGKPTGTNCKGCTTDPDTTDPYRSGIPMLPAGKYVVEMVTPAGYELVKEEDKNILIGDTYIAPVTVQFPNLGGSIFILPDQAVVASSTLQTAANGSNPNNAQNPTSNLGRTTLPSHESDTGSMESYWPCVGAERIVPDFISLFPGSAEVAPFAGATRNLCDRKEVTLVDQTSALAKFYVFTSTHAAAHFTGVVTDDFTSEFDPFSPQFGEKFAPPSLPISIKDWTGNETQRVYTDQWGAYNGLTYSTWEVNPPNPTGYAPQMMVTCMNDPGTKPVPDPLFNPGYSQFCYEIPFMPGQTQYMDTPVTPTTSFSEGYNHPDCAYPDATPAIMEVDGDAIGPWVAASFSGGKPVASVTVNTGGTGYTTAPGVTFTASGGGSGAAATAIITSNGTVGSVTINLLGNGLGYSTVPSITFAGCAGSGASATAHLGTGLLAGSVISVSMNSGGSGYTCTPTATFSAPTGPPSPFKIRATGTAHLSSFVSAVNITNGGSGYISAPTVSFTGGGGTGATATAVLAGGGGSVGVLTITALGDQNVLNNGYSGPSATAAPFNQKTITRHYGFGTTQGTGKVTIGANGSGNPITATVTSWSDSQIKVQVPSGMQDCDIQQQTIYGGSKAQCGQLVITAANGKQSIDAVTVTVGGKAPIHVTASDSIQDKIDAALPGDLLMVDPGTHNELLLMWKPVRLQGAGAASAVINANTHPEGKLDPWRAKVNCLFGLALNGQPVSASNVFDPTYAPKTDTSPQVGYSCGSTNGTAWLGYDGAPFNPQVDRLPLEGILGWDTTVNGNLAQLLQEPTLMGAYEGAGITVLGKGVEIAGKGNPGAGVFGTGAESVFPAGSTLLAANRCLNLARTSNPYPSNFYCNPSSIDGMSITNSSQGGGGVFVHAWGHHLQIANNRIYNNAGTLTGGITVGQGESPDAYLAGDPAPPAPSSCVVDNSPGDVNVQLPYCFDTHVNVHNNAVMLNSSIGDELYSSTPAGGGGVTFCTGADYYKFNYNWVCGNLSTGDGGGIVHLGFIYQDPADSNAGIQHNSIIFNQSTNPTVPTNGGGLLVMGAPPDGQVNGVECGNTAADADCVPGLSDGTGNFLSINANLIMGNAAESGSGGGIRFQGINGTEVGNFPRTSSKWNKINVTNNIIANNVAGWDGGGVSLQDALVVNFINNTIVSNDSTASAGILFNTLGAPIASSPTPTTPLSQGSSTLPQPAGLVTTRNSPSLLTAIAIAQVTCPAGHASGTLAGGDCAQMSYPLLYNNLIWQNRSYYIGVGSLSANYQQNIVSLYNAFSATPAPSQPQSPATTANGNGVTIAGGTGACTTASYWDIGVRGDLQPGDGNSGFKLKPSFSVITDPSDYTGLSNRAVSPNVVRQYCNGSRTPPEAASSGWQVPPGISDATVPNPIFSLTPSATVDEGNNWVNISWGPLALTNAVTKAPLANYAPAIGSPLLQVANAGTNTIAGVPVTVPTTDFFGTARGSQITIGAIQAAGTAAVAPTLTSISPNSGIPGALNLPVTLTGTNLTGATAVNVDGSGITVGPLTVTATSVVTTFTIDNAAATLGVHNVSVTTPSGNTGVLTFTVVSATTPTLSSITPASGNVNTTLTGVILSGTNLVGATSVSVDGLGVTAVMTAHTATTVTATFTIAPGAALGVRNVSVSTTLGVTGPVLFTVTNQTPTLLSITPDSGPTGTTPVNVLVTLTGTNLAGATAVTISGTGVTHGPLTVTATSVTTTFTIATTATLGARTVTVTTTPSVITAPVTFTVEHVAPTLTTIYPASALRPASGSTIVPITLTGANLSATTTMNGLTAGVSLVAGSLKVVDSHTVTAQLRISSGNATTLGPRNISVTNPAGTSNTVQFIVGPYLQVPNPALIAIRGTAATLTFTGAGLTSATGVTVTGNGITVSGFTELSDTSVSAIFTIAANASLTARNVTVQTISGITFTLNNAFTVKAPTLTSITPNQGTRGTAVPVTLTGQFLTGATTVNVSGNGVTAGAVTPVNDTTVTATLTIAANAAFGNRTISVSNGGGATTNTENFNVFEPPPTFTSMAPNTGVRGTTNQLVTLTGTNLTQASSVNAGAGITVTAVTAVNSTTVTARFAISSAATLGAHSVSVTTPGGTVTLTAAYTVSGASITFSAPVLTTTPGNTTTKNATITVSNVAGANVLPLKFTATPSVTKTNGPGTFSVTGGTCTSGLTVNAGSSCTILVRFVPTNANTATAHVNITGTGLGTLSSANFNAN